MSPIFQEDHSTITLLREHNNTHLSTGCCTRFRCPKCKLRGRMIICGICSLIILAIILSVIALHKKSMDSSNITKINCNESINNEMTFVPEKWPWKVLFVSGGKFFCEGSLIDDEWILTSADCTEKHSKNNKNAGMEVVLGYHYVDQLPYSHTKRRVRDILIHPKYNLVKNQYNFALVRLSQVKLSTNVSTISLPDQDCRSLPYGTICHIVSSNFHEDDLNTTVFKKISMKIISNSECQQLYGNKLSIRDSMFCAKHIENGGSVYQGFLGGSLVCYDKKMSRFIQMGVNNGSPKNTGIHVPIMFGKTSKVRRWIDETIAKHNN